MRYFILEPEVAGGMGPNTVMSREQHPPVVSHLHYEFDGWLGDDLLETFPCFIATERLANAIRDARLTGIEFRSVEITTSGEFQDFYPDRTLPSFLWLNVVGKAAEDDFGTTKDASLVVSQRTLDVLRAMGFDNCEVSDYD